MSIFSHEFAFPLGGIDAVVTAPTTVASAGASGAQTGVDYGTDFDVLFDLDPHFGIVRGPKNVAQAAVRRLSCRSGFFADAFEGDPGYGEDLLTGLLNHGIDDRGVAALAGRVRAQVEADPRVASADVDMVFVAAESDLKPTIRLDLNDGPFDLVKPISQVAAADFRPRGA